MTGPAIGELFAGYGGIGIGLKNIWPDASVAWVSDIESGPRKVLAHRYPDAPNLGDITAIDWSKVEPVDIITGGSPCQDLSHAGKRAGMRPGTRSGLWASMCDAIDILRPSLVVWENVRGALSAHATTGEVESCGFCMADDGREPMRALGRVLGDLADIGYDTGWVGLRAADVGACHGRFRVFVLAWPADAASVGREWRWASRAGWAGSADGDRGTVTDLLPTVKATNNENRQSTRFDPHETTNFHGIIRDDTFAQYAPAIARHERMVGHAAPAPVEPTGKNGANRLSPDFTTWMMGLPAGWITDVPGVTRNEALRLCGNGVVPQQCEAAVRHLLTVRETAMTSVGAA